MTPRITGSGFVNSLMRWYVQYIWAMCSLPVLNSYVYYQMNFKKMRKRNSNKPAADGTPTTTRMWERGFLSTDCGFEAKENIGYLQVCTYI
jgi:hypothetical protein